MELGTHQGGTAAAAMLAKPKEIVLVDIDFSKYYKFLAPIAEKWCKENNINLKIKSCSSVDLGSLHNSDMLVIDSVHTPQHMTAELSLHGGNVNKYIIAHDTSVLMGRPNDVLFKVLEQFANANKWKIIERGTVNAGYTVLKK
jgi:cephalosporin hydroxylase